VRDLRTTKMHPLKVEMNNLDVEMTVTDDVVESLFKARCHDNKVELTET
jgi:hypothetical protein